MKTIQFQGETLIVEITRYQSPANICIILKDKNGMQYMKASSNPDFLLLPNYVAIKNYSENKGILAALVEAGVILDLGVITEMNHVELDICSLTEEYRDGQ